MNTYSKLIITPLCLIMLSVSCLFCQNNDSIFDTHNKVNQSVITDTVINHTLYSGNLIVDTTKSPIHSPKKAGIYSAILPGLGQGYNKKYWKIPVIWAGFAATGYFIYQNIEPMDKAHDSYMWVDNGSIGTPPNEYAEMYGYSLSKLESVYNQYRYKIEIFSVVSVAWYLINIVDAVVDAHLMDFEVSDNLTMNVTPYIYPINYAGLYNHNYYAGLSVSFKF